jgi:hypothetical protein
MDERSATGDLYRTSCDCRYFNWLWPVTDRRRSAEDCSCLTDASAKSSAGRQFSFRDETLVNSNRKFMYLIAGADLYGCGVEGAGLPSDTYEPRI